MKLLVGLGNPEEKYQKNRHNVGFMFTDFFFRECSDKGSYNQLQHNWKTDQLFQSEMTKCLFQQEEFILCKPTTFMNNSGNAVRKISAAFKIPTQNIIVAHDDLDIPLSKFKIQRGTGPKIHNGINSIQHHLGTNDFWRIRIGIDNRDMSTQLSGEEYVLQDFKEDELRLLDGIFKHITTRMSQGLS